MNGIQEVRSSILLVSTNDNTIPVWFRHTGIFLCRFKNFFRTTRNLSIGLVTMTMVLLVFTTVVMVVSFLPLAPAYSRRPFCCGLCYNETIIII